MLKAKRYDLIVQHVKKNGSATVEELCSELNVSPATIRRDLNLLDAERILTRTHGGAMSNERTENSEIPVYQRIYLQQKEKEQVATKAVQYIEEGSTIYIGAGTTASMLASKLFAFHHLVVVTNDIAVAHAVSLSGNDLIVTGGQLKKESFTLYGYYTDLMLNEISIDKSFLTTDAVDIKRGFMDFSMDEVEIKRKMIKNAQHSYIMCDVSKFDKNALVAVCSFGEVNSVITNDTINSEHLQGIRQTGIEVILAESR